MSENSLFLHRPTRSRQQTHDRHAQATQGRPLPDGGPADLDLRAVHKHDARHLHAHVLRDAASPQRRVLLGHAQVSRDQQVLPLLGDEVQRDVDYPVGDGVQSWLVR